MDLEKNTKRLKDSIAAQKRKYMFLAFLIIVGIIIGGIFTFLLSNSDKDIIKVSLDHFFEKVKTDELDYFYAFLNSLQNQILPVLLIWILGISIIGVPIILFFTFFKGFLLGFSFSSILVTYKTKGILKACFYVFPHQVFGLFLTLFLCFYALSFSSKLGNVLFLKKDISLKLAMKRYTKVLFITLIGFCFISLMEVFLAPLLLRLV